MNYKVLALSIATGAASMLFTSCQKDKEVVAAPAGTVQTVKLSEAKKRQMQEMVTRVPKLRFYDEQENRFIDFNIGSRDYTFTDPDEGFTFDDPDQNGVIVYADGTGDYIVFNAGIGVAGQGAGGGIVVAGNSTLDMDVTICLTLSAVAEGDGYSDLFDSGFAFDEYGAVIGIAGDFEGLAEADSDSEDFDPFEYFHGFAAYYVLADDLNGSHEVFNWLDATGDENFDDMASSFVMDFSNFSLYFATDGVVTVSNGTMTFEGEYLAIEDLFLDFLEESGEEEPDFNIVSGYGSMGCN